MASIVFQLYTQVRDSGVARLFKGCDGYRNGEQRRDFVHVDDVVSVNLWFLDHLGPSGIFNVGTGCSHTFRDVAAAIIRLLGRGQIKYVPFPAALRGVYQSFTEADLSALRGAGYNRQFKELKEGVAAYVAWLDSNPEQGVSGYTYDH
jgi:ADP-L-glycero-D-manno-heptose 6-epimerase